MGKVLIIGAGGVATVAAQSGAERRRFYRDYDSQPHEIEMRRHCGGYRE